MLQRFLLPLVLAFVMLAGAAKAEEVAGTVLKLKGEAQAISKSGTRPLEIGGSVMVDEAIKTGAGARLAIEFRDGSNLFLGEEAHIIVDELIYSPAADKAEDQSQTVDVLRGVFRYVSGAIAQARYENVTFRTPVATIGIRGTNFVGGELQVGMSPGRPHYGFQIQDGAIEVTAPNGSVLLDEPGEGTFLPLTRLAAPTPVRQWTAEEAQEVEDALAF